MEYFPPQGYILYFQNHTLPLSLQFRFHLVLYRVHSRGLKCNLLLLIICSVKYRQVRVLVV